MPYKDKQRQKEAQKKHYLKNKDKYREGIKSRRRRNNEYVYSLKTRCCECGIDDKICLDFHHVNGKSNTVSQLIRNATTIEKLQIEISKCEVICGNCHRKRHEPLIIEDGSNWRNFGERRIKKRRWFIDFIKLSKCKACSEDDSRCLEFHHLEDKRFTIAYLLASGHSLDYLKEEIDKCEVLCTNCHRKEHRNVV